MLVVISYDIENDRIRTRLAKQLKNFGPRVQKSVFEGDIDKSEMIRLKNMLEKVKLKENDSIRLYQLCQECTGKILIWGRGEVTKDKPYYIV